MAALRVRDVDLTRRRIEVARAVAKVGGRFQGGAPEGPPNAPFRSPLLVDELAEALAGRGPEDPAFPAPKGGMLHNLTFQRRWFDRAATSADLGGLAPHELWHTAASLVVSAGATVKAVQRMLGHASAAMALDVYAGLFADDLDLVAQRLHERKISSDADRLRTGDVVDVDEARETGR